VNSEYWPGGIFEVVFSVLSLYIASHFVPDGATEDPVPSLEIKTRNTFLLLTWLRGVGAKVVELVKNGAVFTSRKDFEILQQLDVVYIKAHTHTNKSKLRKIGHTL